MSNYGNFRQLKFKDIWETATEFTNEYKGSGLAPDNNKIKDASATTLFYLLYSNFADSVIASANIEQFKYQVWSTIFEFGPTWERRVEIQYELRKLTDDELAEGNKQIYNKALNPSTSPTTSELDYISEQTVAKMKRSKLDKYSTLYEILNTDVTSRFISKFKKLFLQIVQPELPLWYNTTLTEEEQ